MREELVEGGADILGAVRQTQDTGRRDVVPRRIGMRDGRDEIAVGDQDAGEPALRKAVPQDSVRDDDQRTAPLVVAAIGCATRDLDGSQERTRGEGGFDRHLGRRIPDLRDDGAAACIRERHRLDADLDVARRAGAGRGAALSP